MAFQRQSAVDDRNHGGGSGATGAPINFECIKKSETQGQVRERLFVCGNKRVALRRQW